jgi:site-specific DNA-methyltransferase (adenine-specific)
MITSGWYTSDSQEWATPQKVFDELDAEFHFTLDPCCTHENAKCEKHYTIEDDGLTKSWGGEVVFCNPPYKDLKKWAKKCYEEFLQGATVVMLVPARTDTMWFHDWIYHKAELRFIKGRLKYNDGKQGAPFPSMIVVYNERNLERH